MRYGDEILTDEYREVLSMIQRVDASAVMAGGCLRDRVMEREVKDIDVFVGPSWGVNAQFGVDPDGWNWLLEFDAAVVAEYSQHFGESILDIWKGYRGTAMDDALFPYFKNDPGAVPIQIIRLKYDPWLPQVLLELDFGFCQIGYGPINGENRLVYTPEFWNDVNRKTATLMRTARDPNYERSLKRAERLKAKYPDFQFNIPGALNEA